MSYKESIIFRLYAESVRGYASFKLTKVRKPIMLSLTRTAKSFLPTTEFDRSWLTIETSDGPITIQLSDMQSSKGIISIDAPRQSQITRADALKKTA